MGTSPIALAEVLVLGVRMLTELFLRALAGANPRDILLKFDGGCVDTGLHGGECLGEGPVTNKSKNHNEDKDDQEDFHRLKHGVMFTGSQDDPTHTEQCDRTAVCAVG